MIASITSTIAILSLRITNSKTIRLINTRLIANIVVEVAIVDIANNFGAIEAIAIYYTKGKT